MPEFILDHGSSEAHARFNDLDAFTQGFITAAFWLIDEANKDATFDELAPETLATMIEDCRGFQELAGADLEKAYDYAPVHYDAERAGVDFWLTRNGHGAGFWDRGLGGLHTDNTVGGRLSRDAKSFSECDLYRGG